MKNKKKVVIIGGGTAGLIVANNLKDKFEVTVIEKSKYIKYPIFYKIPLMIGLLFRDPKGEYIKKRIQYLFGRLIPYFESNMLGGSSVMNGCVHTLGSKELWNNAIKKFKINYEDVLTSFNNIYSFVENKKNRINLTLTSLGDLDEAFLKTLNINGIPKNDMNFADNEGCGAIYVTTNKLLELQFYHM